RASRGHPQDRLAQSLRRRLRGRAEERLQQPLGAIVGSRHTHGMTDEARARWAARRFNNEMRLEARREWEASLPRHPWPEHRVKGEVLDKDEAPPEPERVEEIPARPWEGPLPTSPKSLVKAAEKAGYRTIASFSHQE